MNPTVDTERFHAAPRAGTGLPAVHVVDADPVVRATLSRLLGAAGCYRVHAHGCADDFLAAYDPEAHACLVLDVGARGPDALAMQDQLREHLVSIVLLSNYADVPMCADAMRRGAVDFLAKPIDESLFLMAISRALAHDAGLRTLRAHQSMTAARMASLTPREREVLSHVMAGRLNKQIASDIGVVEKTVKVHRARGMQKMRVRSVAELVRLVERGRVWPAGLQFAASELPQ